MRSKRLVAFLLCLGLVKGVIQARHLEYSSTQSMVVLITDIIAPHGFLLIQARAPSSGSSLIQSLLATSLWTLPRWLGLSPVRMEGGTAGQRDQARLPIMGGSEL